jgi:hypothetical protein
MLHDNACTHMAASIIETLNQLKSEVLIHPVLALFDCHLKVTLQDQ